MTLFKDILSSTNLQMAWEHVRKNKGCAGCDGITIDAYPCVNDRVIQQAIAQQLEWIIDPTFSEHSDGFRPYRSAHQAIKAVQAQIKAKRRYAVDID